MRRYIAAIIVFVFLIALVVLPRDLLRHVVGTFHPAPVASSEDIAQLRARVASDDALLAAYPSSTFSTPLHNGRVSVPVYAYYPFNYQHELLIGGGSKQGIAVNDAVLLDVGTSTPGMLIGRVVNVADTTARVRTIFDPQWRSAVRVGTSSTDGLLEGGVTPKLSLLSKDASLADGDIIYNADQQFPLGIALGTLGPVNDIAGGASREGLLQVPYDINTVHVVSIVSHGK
jgi:cell shape-determining protein MreC